MARFDCRNIAIVTITFREGQYIAPCEFLGREAIEQLARDHQRSTFFDEQGRLCVTLDLPVKDKQNGAG